MFRSTRLFILAHLALVALASFSGCATDSGGPPEADNAPDWRSGGKGDGQSCDFDQESATTYLSHFQYTKLEGSDGRTRYRVAFTFGQRAVLPNGDSADVTAYLLDGGRAILDYSELHRVDATESTVQNETVVVTRYSVDPTSRALTIDGVGKGTPLTVTDNGGCAPAYQFTYGSDLRTAGLAGGNTALYAGTSTGFVIDPDHLDQVPSEDARRWFEEDVASGKIVVIRK